jgi:hypothetical protein
MATSRTNGVVPATAYLLTKNDLFGVLAGRDQNVGTFRPTKTVWAY